MAVKVVALDVYGTILPISDTELGSRKGLEELLDYCDNNKILVVTSSDCPNPDVKFDLEKAKVNHWRFDCMVCLYSKPKDFFQIIDLYGIQPNELLVVGDSVESDIKGAINAGAQYVHVKPYTKEDDYSLSELIKVIELIE